MFSVTLNFISSKYLTFSLHLYIPHVLNVDHISTCETRSYKCAMRIELNPDDTSLSFDTFRRQKVQFIKLGFLSWIIHYLCKNHIQDNKSKKKKSPTLRECICKRNV